MIYTFRCKHCKKDFESDMSYEAYLAALHFECPYCCSTNVSRTYRWSEHQIQFKGQGFTKSTKQEEE